MEVQKSVLYPEDVARESGLGLSTIYKLLKKGQICHVKAGDRYLVSRANYEKWLSGESQKENQNGYQADSERTGTTARTH